MRTVNQEGREAKKAEIMEKCFACYAEHGLGAVGIKGLAEACGVSSGTLYFYFDNLDDLILRSTEHCMRKVEDDFMEKAPKDVRDLQRFIEGIPRWTAEKHGSKYRLMYQVYTHPKSSSGIRPTVRIKKKKEIPRKSISANLGIFFDLANAAALCVLELLPYPPVAFAWGRFIFLLRIPGYCRFPC